MGQSPSWEANRFLASQEILHILWNPKLHYRMYKSPPPAPNLSQINLVHHPPPPPIPLPQGPSSLISLMQGKRYQVPSDEVVALNWKFSPTVYWWLATGTLIRDHLLTKRYQDCEQTLPTIDDDWQRFSTGGLNCWLDWARGLPNNNKFRNQVFLDTTRFVTEWFPTFREKAVHSTSGINCSVTSWPFQMKALRYFETSGITQPTTQSHIPEDFNAQNKKLREPQLSHNLLSQSFPTSREAFFLCRGMLSSNRRVVGNSPR
jgi:hypothetical protein